MSTTAVSTKRRVVLITDDQEWFSVRKRPVQVEARGPFTSTDEIATLEGDFEIDDEYLDEHIAYYLIRGVDGELYPCAAHVFWRTYELVGDGGETDG